MAKLAWSQGVSEFQIRDCRLLIELNPRLDWQYIERWARSLGVRSLIDAVRHAG